MRSNIPTSSGDRPPRPARIASEHGFTEAPAWRDVGAGWQPVFGNFRGLGYSVEWHDFFAKKEFDWAASFHPDCIELCLNLEGQGFVEGGGRRAEFMPNTAGFYHRQTEPLVARRLADQQHRFLTVEFSCPFLARHLADAKQLVHPCVLAAMDGCPCKFVTGSTVRLTSEQLQTIASLRRPPVYAAAQPMWYQCKALELAVTFLFQPPPEGEMFCTRQQRLAQERFEQVVFLLKQNLAEPPSLEVLGRKIGCSPFYLSRIFSNHSGQTIPQYLRRLRMERAAELLRVGDHNVTETALEVGYSSLSHFSAAFHETFGCCPGLFPLRTPTQTLPLNLEGTG